MTDILAPTIEGFEIIGKLGQGGMATVWMARQVSLDRSVAIKVLLPRFAVDDEEVARFHSEAQAAARLKHPGIVQVYDASVANGCYYFIMEYIAGYTVGDWLRRKGVLPERDALLVAEHVSDALAYAWDHAKIIHCDIKPDNVMIDDDGTVKVMDLGLARTLNAMSSYNDEEDYVLGTPSYMSPEQARGDAHLDFRSDIYALGAMLYHMVTGKRLFSETDAETTLEMQITGTAEDPMDLNTSLSRPICALIERMLAKNPDLRGESWQTVHADMRRVYSGLMPHQTLQADDMSTVRRSEHRATVDTDRLKRLTSNATHTTRSSAIWTTLWIAIAAIGAAMAIKFYLVMASHTPPAPPRPSAPPPTLPAAPPQPPKPPTAPAASTPEKRPNTQQQIAELQQKLAAFKDAGDYTQAEALIAAYPGDRPEDKAFRERMRLDIQRHREARASQQRMAERKRQEQLAGEIMTPVMQTAANAIIRGDLQQALDLIRPLRARDDLSWYHDSLLELEKGLDALIRIDEWILETFRMDQGRTIEVALVNGRTQLMIGDLQNGRLQCFQYNDEGGLQALFITAQQLSAHERVARLNIGHPSVAAIARGMMAFRAGDYERAATAFRGAHFLISDPLLRLAEQKKP
jgi:serine/threonine protein kinase